MDADSIALLCSEGPSSAIHETDIAARLTLVRAIRDRVSPKIWSRLEYLQPQVGCFNLCSFCSQSAGADIWQFTSRGLRNLFSALKTVLLDIAVSEGRLKCPEGALLADEGTTWSRETLPMPRGGLIGYGRAEHKPGVIFPYLDNDVFSYEHLDDFIRYASEDLGAMVRLTSVGYSRHNRRLQSMHERIRNELSGAIDGLRLSWTPYAYGWNQSGKTVPAVNRVEFIADFSNTLRTYRPVVEFIGRGKDKACVEIRFPPLVRSSESMFHEFSVHGFHAISAGPYLLVSRERNTVPEISRITQLQSRVPIYSRPSVPYTLLICQHLVDACEGDIAASAQTLVDRYATSDEESWDDAGDQGLGPAARRIVKLFQLV